LTLEKFKTIEFEKKGHPNEITRHHHLQG